MKRMNTASSPSMNVGTPNTANVSTASVCSAISVFSGRPLHTSSATSSTSRPTSVTTAARARLLVTQLQTLVEAGGERPDVEVEEVFGEVVAHRDAVEQWRDARAPLRRVALPHRRLTFLDVRLVEREREEADVEVDPLAQRGDDRLVRVAGERAPVVERHGELSGHGAPPRVRCGRPRRYRAGNRVQDGSSGTTLRATRPKPRPSALPATMSEPWCRRTYTRLNATRPASA